MKAQASMEYILLFGISLALVAVLWSVSSSNLTDTQWDLQRAYAKNSLDKITQTADIAYVQGSPTQIYVQVNFPDNVRAVYIINNTVTMELWWKGILRNISADSSTNLTGSIAPSPGGHRLFIQSGSLISITDA